MAVLLFDEKKDNLLLQKRVDNGLWGLTGGFMEPGETFEETVHRETFEELGMTLESISFISLFSGAEFYYQYPNGDEVYSVIAVYSATHEAENFNLDQDEVSEVKFYSVEHLPENINPNHKTVHSHLLRVCPLYYIRF